MTATRGGTFRFGAARFPGLVRVRRLAGLGWIANYFTATFGPVNFNNLSGDNRIDSHLSSVSLSITAALPTVEIRRTRQRLS